MSRVRLNAGDAVARLTLARPDKKNALDRRMADEIVAGLSALAERDETRVIVIDGEGEDFCAGADLESLEALLDKGRDAQLDDARALGRIFTSIRHTRVPVVAAVQGRAIAGGAGLAVGCDLVLAHPDASFAFPEVRIGFVPAMVMSILRRATTERHAFDLAVTGRTVSAAEAMSLGLVTRVLAGSGFTREVGEYCSTLAKSPADAIARTKRLFYDLDGNFDGDIERGAQANADARSTEEFRTGVRSFLRRRRGDR